MPETKKPSTPRKQDTKSRAAAGRGYEARSQNRLDGVRIAPSGGSQAAEDAAGQPEQVSLVEKLIQFFQAME